MIYHHLFTVCLFKLFYVNKLPTNKEDPNEIINIVITKLMLPLIFIYFELIYKVKNIINKT